MRLNDLMDLVAVEYADSDALLAYWDRENEQPTEIVDGGGDGVDTLAQFIVQEIASTYDEDDTDRQQLLTAVNVLATARNDLDAIVKALAEKAC